MAGQAIVTINDNQWTVSLATTYPELTIGLRGAASLPAGTGMLFILPTKQAVSANTTDVNFPLDIIFIADNSVIDVARNIQPNYLVTEETPWDMALEVNAGEAATVEAGDTVSTATIQQGFDISQIMSFAMPLAALGFVCAMVGGMASFVGGSAHSSLGHLSSPEEATFPPEARKDLTFCKHMWDLEKTMGRPFTREEVSQRWERWKELRYRPKTEEERRLAHSLKYGTEELPERGKGLESHSEYAPYIHETRKIGGKVIKKYSVAATDLIVYEAWEPSAIMGKHSSITSIDGQWYGRIGTRYLPPELEKLPAGSEERLRAVGKWHEDQYEEAYKLIIQAFSEAEAGRRSMGEITLHWLGEHHSQEEEETRFIGACKIVDGLCHTHGYSVSKGVRCPKSPLTDEEWAAAWELAEAAYPEGMSNPWVNGWWPETLEEAEKAAREYEWKMKDAVRMFREKQRAAIENYERGADKAVYNYRRYVVGEYETGKELSVIPSAVEHHSMWLTPEQRKECEAAYGAVACRWGEELAAVGDFETVRRAAKTFYTKMKEAVGIA